MLLLLLHLALADEFDPTSLRSSVSDERLLGDVKALTGLVRTDVGTIRSRNVYHPDAALAQAWIEARLGELDGLEVWTEPVDGPWGEASNVIAELPGSRFGLSPVVVSAHWDSTASGEDGWDATTDPAPGADDDASGVAAVLEIARHVSEYRPGFERPIRFVLFAAEEEGLVGSTAHVASLVASGGDILVDYQLDPVGYDAGEHALWAAYHPWYQVDATDVAVLPERLGLDLTVQPVDGLLVGDDRSDHYPFWQAGLPAVHLGTFPLNPAYHTTDDTLDHVDVRFLGDVTATVLFRVAGDAIPNPEGCGCSHVTPGAGWAVAVAMAWTRRRRSAPR